MIEKITNYREKIRDRILGQWRNAPNSKVVLDAIADELQELEDSIYDVLLYRNIQNGSYKILDLFGTVLDEDRPLNASDDDYKKILFAKIIVNRSEGKRSDIINILKVLGATNIFAQDLYPATMQINYTGIDPDFLSVAEVKELLEKGTHPIKFDISSYETDYFGFASDPLAKGFGVGELGSSI